MVDGPLRYLCRRGDLPIRLLLQLLRVRLGKRQKGLTHNLASRCFCYLTYPSVRLASAVRTDCTAFRALSRPPPQFKPLLALAQSGSLTTLHPQQHCAAQIKAQLEGGGCCGYCCSLWAIDNCFGPFSCCLRMGLRSAMRSMWGLPESPCFMCPCGRRCSDCCVWTCCGSCAQVRGEGEGAARPSLNHQKAWGHSLSTHTAVRHLSPGGAKSFRVF